VLHREGQHEHEMQNLEDRWEAMVSRLGSESFPDFLRVHWNSRRPLVRQTELFKVIRRNVRNREEAFALLRDMDADVDPYLGLRDPESSNWHPSLKDLARVLKMFTVRQPYSFLLACYRTFSLAEFEDIFRAIVVISFRYNVVVGGATQEQERAYSAAANKLIRGEATSKAQAISLLSSIYPEDNRFKAAFADKIIRTTDARNNRVVRYILCRLEKHLTTTDLDFTGETFGVEHVLPQSPHDGWSQFTDEQVEAFTYRLGNMTLLSTNQNRDLGNLSYSEKRAVYSASTFAVTRHLGENYSDWGPEQIAAHQTWMANQATAIWRIAQFG
jgi:hypothetical protein